MDRIVAERGIKRLVARFAWLPTLTRDSKFCWLVEVYTEQVLDFGKYRNIGNWYAVPRHYLEDTL